MELLYGAGFASGKEIYVFFAKFGIYGIVGAIISAILTGNIIYKTIKIVKKYNIESNNKFIDEVSKSKNNKIQKINKKFLKSTINIFLVISFFIMMAGFSSYFKQRFNIQIIVSSLIMSIILYITFLNNIEGIMKINEVVIPILLIILTYLIVKTPINMQTNLIKVEPISQLFQEIVMAIIYASYNSVLLIPIIISVNKYMKSNKEIKKIEIFITIIIIALSIGMMNIIWNSDIDIESVDLPIIKILERNEIEENLYSLVLIIAIFTSAVSAGYGFLENIKNRRQYKKIAILMCLAGIVIAHIGFGKLVEFLYPLFGLIGVFQIILIEREYKKI